MQNVPKDFNYWEGTKDLMEKKLGVTEARRRLNDIIEEVQYRGDTYVISRYGKPAAAVVPIEVYEDWQRQRKEFFALINEIQEENPDADPDEVMEDVLEAQQAVRCSQ